MKELDPSLRMYVFAVRLTLPQLAKLKRDAKKLHKTPSQYVREKIG